VCTDSVAMRRGKAERRASPMASILPDRPKLLTFLS
jgi:hypothetical protein